MFSEIETELNVLEKKKFTGYVKFGVEHGSVMSMSITTKVEPTVSGIVTNWQKEITEIFDDENEFYGSVDFSFNFGRKVSCNFSTTLHGEQLKSRLRKNQCRNVRTVVRKSDT